ncbi:hypothetical protein MNBD_GAMMA09-3182 [hydrothermal vent metagenome]|uniref:Uncharacterized protein n=1 Tax=hydrothermal vent metagenome TaxID=652676 RepID=A0A3B0YJQ3_9ZZZZ
MKIHSFAILTLILSALFLPTSSTAQGEEGLNKMIDMIVDEMSNSTEFNKNMKCMGASDQQITTYLEQFKKDYRYCLSKFPQNKDGGAAFLSCWTPKVNASFKNLDISESVIKKCKS